MIETDWTCVTSVERLAERQERTLGTTSPTFADTLVKLGDLYFLEEQFERAEKTYWRALGIRQKVLGDYNKDTAAVLQCLAELYEIQDRYAEAEKFYQWATTVKKNAMLKVHSDQMERTQQLKTIKPVLPQLTEMEEKCANCGKQLLDSTACMYCTQSGFDAMALIRSALEEAPPPPKQKSKGPVNLLVAFSGKHTFRLDSDEVTIGRHPSNRLVFADDKTMSRYHAKVIFRDGNFYIEDRGTSNGTLVNETRLAEPLKLEQGDVITMGITTLIAQYQENE